MTQLRYDSSSIRNYFDRWIDGVGHRGSSFVDLDAITHDGHTDRFLVQEFKRPNEACSSGQWRLLDALTRVPGFTVWYVMRMADDQLAWADLRWPDTIDVIEPAEYRARFARWWSNTYEEWISFKVALETGDAYVVRASRASWRTASSASRALPTRPMRRSPLRSKRDSALGPLEPATDEAGGEGPSLRART